MAKKRKTRSQKKKADHRHTITLNAPALTSETTSNEIEKREQFSYAPKSKASITSSPQSVKGYEYLATDLRKTLFTTGTIIVVQLILAFAIHTI